MPWHIEKSGDEFCVIKDSDGSKAGCHPSKDKANAQLRALYANEPAAKSAWEALTDFKPAQRELVIMDPKQEDSMERKSVGVSGFKILDDATGTVETVVSVTGVVDRVQDNILPGAYEKTLAARTPKGVYSHNWEQPISKTLSAEELRPGDTRLPKKIADAGGGGLLIQTQFNLDTQRGREAYSDVKFYGEDQEWSVGYKVPLGKSSIDKKSGVREIQEMDLYEYSPVLFGAMPLANTVAVKDLAQAVKEVLFEEKASCSECGGKITQDEQGQYHHAAGDKGGHKAKPATKADKPKPGDKPSDMKPHDFVDENGDGKCDVCNMTEKQHEMVPAGKGSVPADTYGEPGYATQGRPTIDPVPSVAAQAPTPDGSGDAGRGGGPTSDTGAGRPGPGGATAQGDVQGIPSVPGQAPAPSGAGQGSGVAGPSRDSDIDPRPGPGGDPAQDDVQGIPSVGAQAPAPSGDGDEVQGAVADTAIAEHAFQDGGNDVCSVEGCGRGRMDHVHAGQSKEDKGSENQTTHKFKGPKNGNCSVCGELENVSRHAGYSTADPNPGKILDAAYELIDLSASEQKIGRVLSSSNVAKVKAAISALQDVLTIAGAGEEQKGDESGHPFRGNQYTGDGGSDKTPSDKTPSDNRRSADRRLSGGAGPKSRDASDPLDDSPDFTAADGRTYRQELVDGKPQYVEVPPKAKVMVIEPGQAVDESTTISEAELMEQANLRAS